MKRRAAGVGAGDGEVGVGPGAGAGDSVEADVEGLARLSSRRLSVRGWATPGRLEALDGSRPVNAPGRAGRGEVHVHRS